MDYKDIVKSEYFKKVYSEVEELKKDFYVNHGFLHINNVIKNAEYLADLFMLSSKQKELLLIASALHDIGYLKGRESHAKNGGILAGEYLKGKMPNEEAQKICNAISRHGGKKESDFEDPISLCLILADKFDFGKQRYQDDGKEHDNLKMFLSIEKILLTKIDEKNFELKVYTTNKELFEKLEESYFFNKLIEVLKKVENVWGYKIKINFVDFANLKKGVDI